MLLSCLVFLASHWNKILPNKLDTVDMLTIKPDTVVLGHSDSTTEKSIFFAQMRNTSERETASKYQLWCRDCSMLRQNTNQILLLSDTWQTVSDISLTLWQYEPRIDLTAHKYSDDGCQCLPASHHHMAQNCKIVCQETCILLHFKVISAMPWYTIGVQYYCHNVNKFGFNSGLTKSEGL